MQTQKTSANEPLIKMEAIPNEKAPRFKIIVLLNDGGKYNAFEVGAAYQVEGTEGYKIRYCNGQTTGRSLKMKELYRNLHEKRKTFFRFAEQQLELQRNNDLPGMEPSM